MFFSSLWAFFRGAAFRPGASSVAFSWSLSPCRLSRGLACRSLCAFSGLGVVGSLFSRRVTCAALKYFCRACGRRKFFLSCQKPTSFSVRPQNPRGTVGVRAHTSPKCSARSLLFIFFEFSTNSRSRFFYIFFVSLAGLAQTRPNFPHFQKSTGARRAFVLERPKSVPPPLNFSGFGN